jgi:predicted methyltransferase
MDFSFLINKLINTKFLNDFIKKSSADFDNLAIIIKLSTDNNIVKINKDGRIKYLSFFEKNQKIFFNENKLIPNNKLNQFPCDVNSRKRRAKFIIDRYPFVEYLRFAIIGEDDFISPFFKDMNNFSPIVLEKDKRIIKKLKSINKNLKIFDIDLAKENSFDECNIPDISTFITDPPYTFNGALLFIMRGLSLLSDNSELKEFYVVLNPTMMGKNIQKIIDILSASQVFLYGVIENFSQYKLPINFKERERANNFLRKMKIKEDSLLYSSSSNLYIFRTYKPSIKNIKEYINLKKLYQHYL